MIRPGLIALALMAATPTSAKTATWFYLATYTGAPFPQLSGAYSAVQCAAMKRLGEQNNADVSYACLPTRIKLRDRRCEGSARYEAMRDGGRSGFGTGNACQ